MKRVVVLPTLVTAANGYCGVLALYKVHDGLYYQASALILLAMVFDMLDGLVARVARVTSRFGAQLDSLSDAISFGLAPAFLTKAVVETRWPEAYGPKLLTLLTAIFALCALLRLARYNVEHASGEGSDRKGKEVSRFAGIPTPGAAGVVASLVFLAEDPGALIDYRLVLYLLPILCFALAGLMVSRVTYLHFGHIFLQGRRDFGYLFVVLVLAALATRWPEECAAIGFLAYAISGPVLGLLRLKTPRGGEGDDADQERDLKESVDIPDGL